MIEKELLFHLIHYNESDEIKAIKELQEYDFEDKRCRDVFKIIKKNKLPWLEIAKEMKMKPASFLEYFEWQMTPLYTALITVLENSLKRRISKLSKQEVLKEYERIDRFKLAKSEIRASAHYLESLDDKKSKNGFNTGFYKVDENTKGLKKGHFWAIGGYTNVGKSQFVVQVIDSVLIQNGKVLFISLEMPEDDVMERFSNYHEKKHGDFIKFIGEKENDFHITSKVYSIDQVENLLSENYDVVVIDFIQILDAFGKTEYEKMTTIARKLQVLAQKFNTCVVALSQIPEDAQKNQNSNMLSFKGSGAIGSAVNVGIILNRNFKEEKGHDIVPFEIILRKNRHGQTGSFEVSFDKRTGFILNT